MHPTSRKLAAILCGALAWLILATPAEGRLGPQYQMPLGNPDGASTNSVSRTKFLINQRAQYVISYNDNTHQANWVGWSYSLADDGNQARTDYWQAEELLPSGYLKIGTATFGTGWDRGHMTPSADRTKDLTNNQVTFRMSNIIPQASQNNQGLWANFEDYCRTMAADGDEVVIISGPAQFSGSRLNNQMSIPGSVWKIAVEIPNATSATPANQRITTSARVIALLTPNTSTGLGPWQSYITSVEAIEDITGFTFFDAITNQSTAIYLKNLVDTGTGPNTPTVVTTFNPTLGAVGTPVTISGFNFVSPVVSFNGTPAAVISSSANSITVNVPSGATSGFIEVTGANGTDTSYEPFTVTTGSTPTLGLSPTSLSGLTANEGAAGTPAVYALTGSNLTNMVTAAAPANFELSKDGGATFADALTFDPDIAGSLGAQINIRIKAGAAAGNVSGTATHVGGGAISAGLAVSGTVVSSSPHLSVSASSLTGFAALQGSAGSSKSYTVSGANLTGSITITAPTGYEVSLDNSTFAATRTLTPVGGTITNATVYARLSAAAPLGSNTGSISHAGGSATTQNVSVSGTVNAPGSGESWIATSGSNTKGSINTGQSFAGKTGIWLNEFHYDTTSTDVGEFVEVVVGPEVTTALSNISLLLYNGGDGAVYGTHALSTFTLGSTVDGYRIFHKDIAGIQNGAPDGFAITVNGTVTRFLSYEGTFTAASGAAAGMTSVDVGVSETGVAVGSSLQLTGSVGSSTPVPVITVSGPATATALQAFTYQIQANNSPTSYDASGLPAGLSINNSTGLISGTPTTPGSYTVGLTASNAGGDGTATLALTVNPDPNAPVIAGPFTVTAAVGVIFNYQITASNNATTYLAGGLPAGLSIDPLSGLISGEPTAAGSSSVSITASNASGSDTETLTIIVLAPAIEVSQAEMIFAGNFGQASAAQTYILTGSDLGEAITVLAPGNFEVSDDGGTSYFDELTIAPAPDRKINATIDVRMKSSAPLGENSGAIINSGANAVPKYVQLNGFTDVTAATLDLSAWSLTGFSTKTGTPSLTQSYNVSGVGLTEPVTISAPAGFQISSNNNSFGSALTLMPDETGNIKAQEIFVRLSSATAGTFTGSIEHSGGGAESKYLAVSGGVTVPLGPPIISPLSGSAYTSASFRTRVLIGGSLVATSFGASGLPGTLQINQTNGIISGVVPSAAGTNIFSVSATTQDGTTTTNYNLRVVSSTEQNSIPTSVVVNKFQNGLPDRVELLVIGNTNDAAPGPPVDMRGMILKDFSANRTADDGGKFRFADHEIWSKVKAGTLIVLSAGTQSTEDTDPADFVLRVNLGNSTLIKQEAAGFDIDDLEMVLIKPASMGVEGIAGGIHALAAGKVSGTTVYGSYTGKKIRSDQSLNNSRAVVYATATSLSGYNSTEDKAALTTSSLEFGLGNTASNRSYITSLRGLDQTPPTVTLNGQATVNLTIGQSYTELGASVSGGLSTTATVSGSVNTSLAGTYTLTYSGTDTAGNVGTATRTVIVGKAAPNITQPPTASPLTAGQKLSASTLSGGTASVPGTFAWSNPDEKVTTAGTAQYQVTFTPTDTANYNTATAMVSVTANQGTAFESWIADYNLASADAAEAADPDRDGLNNRMEFDLGRNPTRGEGWARSVASAGGQLKVVYWQRIGADFTVQTSTDLPGGFPGTATATKTESQSNVPAGYEQYEATVPSTNGRAFLRIRATQP